MSRIPCSIATLVLATIVATGCASSSRSTSPTSTVSPGAAAGAGEWSMQGWRIIACCCNTPCPCRMNYKPTHCHGCDNTNVIHINKGSFGGVNMDGVTYVIAARVFGEEPGKNWAYVYVDDDATEAQFNAVKAHLEAAVASLGDKQQHLVGQFLGMRRAPMSVSGSSESKHWHVVIPEVLDLDLRYIVLPGRTEPVRSANIFDDYGEAFIHADCITHTYNDPQIKYSWNLNGRQCNWAPFDLTSTRFAKGGIGWGCWSAHAEFNNASEYQERSIGHQ